MAYHYNPTHNIQAAMKIHHTTESDKKCSQCGDPFIWFWKDKEEKNGWHETMYGSDKICGFCIEENTGSPPKSLQELNEERKMRATYDN